MVGVGVRWLATSRYGVYDCASSVVQLALAFFVDTAVVVPAVVYIRGDCAPVTNTSFTWGIYIWPNAHLTNRSGRTNRAT